MTLCSRPTEPRSTAASPARPAIEHVAVVASQGRHVVDGVYHIQNVNAYMSRQKGWLRPFNGVATKNLPTYLGWRRMIEREADRLTPRRSIACALG